jgi:tRNA modification GTPase
MVFSNCVDPCITCSSGNDTNTAISIIRISGFKTISYFKKFFSKTIDYIKPNYFYFNNLIFNKNKHDSILFVFFKSPNSFNGENILELHVHGNKINVDFIINNFISNCSDINLTLAKPGEFTYRAYLNKKLSFSQVEGLDILLNANSIDAFKSGYNLLSGNVFTLFKELHSSYLNFRSTVEASLDFADDFGSDNLIILMNNNLNQLKTIINKLNSLLNFSKDVFEHPMITLYGTPNAGKSSLFNSLLNFKRSIINETPGTTRDYISENIYFNYTYFKLIDTAGLRRTTDDIEAEGINNCLSLVKKSLLNILVINPILSFSIINEFINKSSFDLIVATHSDLYDQNKFSNLISETFDTKNLYFTNSMHHDSVLFNDIFQQAHNKYQSLLFKDKINLDRHALLINDIYKKINILDNTKCHDVGIFSTEVYFIGQLIEELIGTVTNDEVLNNLFSNFCIGK